jgi:hypothetical protein
MCSSGSRAAIHVHVATAVLAEAMDDQQHGFDVSFRNPVLIIDFRIPDAFEVAFYVIHSTSSSASYESS